MTRPDVFDRNLVRQRRERAAKDFGEVDFLVRHVAGLLIERLGDVRRRFPLALDLGCHTGELGRALAREGQVDEVIGADLAPGMATRADGLRVVADEEVLPFGRNTFDLVISAWSLHWVNDLPGTLVQLHHALKPDGLLVAALPGVGTLAELREALVQAESDLTGGAALRVSPFVDVRDAGMLLQRAGFALPVVDLEPLTVSYPHPIKLLAELRAMGETAAPADGGRPLGRATLQRALELYLERFDDGRGRVPATFNVVVMTAWKPDPSQQQPSLRGSGQINLARALDVPLAVLEGNAKPER